MLIFFKETAWFKEKKRLAKIEYQWCCSVCLLFMCLPYIHIPTSIIWDKPDSVAVTRFDNVNVDRMSGRKRERELSNNSINQNRSPTISFTAFEYETRCCLCTLLRCCFFFFPFFSLQWSKMSFLPGVLVCFELIWGTSEPLTNPCQFSQHPLPISLALSQCLRFDEQKHNVLIGNVYSNNIPRITPVCAYQTCMSDIIHLRHHPIFLYLHCVIPPRISLWISLKPWGYESRWPAIRYTETTVSKSIDANRACKWS